MNVVKVTGERKDHEVIVYGLSTCAWCKRTKQFPKDSRVKYEYVDIDLVNPEDRKKIDRELRKWKCQAYPAVLIDNKKLIVGFKVDELKEALQL